jgi:hypothetical protein
MIPVLEGARPERVEMHSAGPATALDKRMVLDMATVGQRRHSAAVAF